MAKPFFYRIDSADFFTLVNSFRTEKELGKFIKQFSCDLITKQGNSDYAKQIISEAIEYIGKKSKAGRDGGNQKASNARAVLGQCYDSASSKTVARNSTEAVKKEKNKPLSSTDEVFAKFWSIYPRKVARGAAEKAWAKIKQPAEILSQIEATLAWQITCDDWVKENGKFIPYPASYLNARRWMDEDPEPVWKSCLEGMVIR
jgi:hypothetical protein